MDLVNVVNLIHKLRLLVRLIPVRRRLATEYGSKLQRRTDPLFADQVRMVRHDANVPAHAIL